MSHSGDDRYIKNYGQKGGVLYIVRSEMVHRCQIYKNYRRRCSNSGGIDQNVCRISSSAAGELRSHFSSFLDACGGVICTKFPYPDQSALYLYNNKLDYYQRILKKSYFFAKNIEIAYFYQKLSRIYFLSLSFAAFRVPQPIVDELRRLLTNQNHPSGWNCQAKFLVVLNRNV